jgi:hypothetical protein
LYLLIEKENSLYDKVLNLEQRRDKIVQIFRISLAKEK